MYFQVFLSIDYPTFFGIGRNIITDNSTAPDFREDDYLLTLCADDYNVGDVVVYTTHEGEILTDTIIEISDNKYYFKNSDAESAVFEFSINGNVIFTFHNIGTIVAWIESPYGTIAILMIITLIVEIPHVIDHIRQIKNLKIT